MGAGKPTHQLYVHFIPGKEAQLENRPWVIHSTKGCHKVGKVEFETVDGMSTGEVAPAIGSEHAVCACGVSNHHLAMCGVVHVETRLFEGLGKRDVGIIRRASTDDEDDAECNARGFRAKISKLSSDLKEITKESAQRAQRAEQLEGRLRKTDTKLSAARKEMADAVETLTAREETIQTMKEAAEKRNKDMSMLMESVKALRAEGKGQANDEMEAKLAEERDARAKLKKQWDASRAEAKQQRKSLQKKLTALQEELATLRANATAIATTVDTTIPAAAAAAAAAPGATAVAAAPVAALIAAATTSDPHGDADGEVEATEESDHRASPPVSAGHAEAAEAEDSDTGGEIVVEGSDEGDDEWEDEATTASTAADVETSVIRVPSTAPSTATTTPRISPESSSFSSPTSSPAAAHIASYHTAARLSPIFPASTSSIPLTTQQAPPAGRPFTPTVRAPSSSAQYLLDAVSAPAASPTQTTALCRSPPPHAHTIAITTNRPTAVAAPVYRSVQLRYAALSYNATPHGTSQSSLLTSPSKLAVDASRSLPQLSPQRAVISSRYRLEPSPAPFPNGASSRASHVKNDDRRVSLDGLQPRSSFKGNPKKLLVTRPTVYHMAPFQQQVATGPVQVHITAPRRAPSGRYT